MTKPSFTRIEDLLTPEGTLTHSFPYVRWCPNYDGRRVTLDGEFTAEELKLIADWLAIQTKDTPDDKWKPDFSDPDFPERAYEGVD